MKEEPSLVSSSLIPHPSSLLVVGLAVVFGGLFGGDVPAAVVAGRGLVVAAVAVERAAVEELLQALAVLGCQGAGVEFHGQFAAAAVALVLVVLLEDGGVVVVEA